MSTMGIVLVHGGFHSSTCWDPVLPYLRGDVVAVDLPGRGNRPADLATVTLADCVSAVMDAADHAGFDRFVLVGHSAGGVTITETAYWHPHRVTRLIYVAGLVPPPGASAAKALTGMNFPPGELPMIEETVARALFGNDLSEAQWVTHWASVVPETAEVMNAHLSGYPRDVPMTYVGLTEDVPVPPFAVEQMVANLGADVERQMLSAGHTAMLSKPRELAELINERAVATFLHQNVR